VVRTAIPAPAASAPPSIVRSPSRNGLVPRRQTTTANTTTEPRSLAHIHAVRLILIPITTLEAGRAFPAAACHPPAVNQDDRALFDQALEHARASAYSRDEFVGQESFMAAGEIRALAQRAGIGPGVAVLDLCCGVAGPGRFITRELGCAYFGVDSSPSAIEIARERAGHLPCRFEVARIPPIPAGPFEVVLLLETMLEFREKETLLREVSRALAAGGRFAFTLEEGLPLTEAERQTMPASDTVWLTPLEEMLGFLEGTGLVVRWQEDHSRSHRAVADSLIAAFSADAADIAERIGSGALEDLLAAHRLWSEWLGEGRVRKMAFVAEKTGAGA